MNHSTEKQSFAWLPWIICGLAAVFYAYEYLLRVAPSVMLPELMKSFGVSAASLGILTSSYYWAYTPIQLPVGPMMDRFGPRRILTVAILFCTLGTGFFALTTNLYVAGFGRFLIGFGSAFAFVGVLKLATIWLPPERFGLVAGLATTLGMLGAISGERILGKAVHLVGWEQTVLYSGIVGLVLTPLIWFVVRDRGKQAVHSHQHAKIDASKLMKDCLNIVKNSQIWLNGLIAGLMFLPISVFAELWGVEYLKVAKGLTLNEATIGTSMIFLGWAIGGPLVGALSDKIRRRKRPMLVGSFMASLFVFLLMYGPIHTTTAIYLNLFAVGFVCSAQVIAFAVGRENCPIYVTGTAVAVTNFFISFFGGGLQPVVGRLLDTFWDGTTDLGIHVYTVSDYQSSLALVPVGLMLASFLTLFLKETHCIQKT